MDDAERRQGARGGSVLNPGERMVTLIDGREVSNYSEEWRFECEARTVCKMTGYVHIDPNNGRRTPIPARSVRNKYMHNVGERRGVEYERRLRDMVFHIWDAEFKG